jgi:hypothetical protein
LIKVGIWGPITIVGHDVTDTVSQAADGAKQSIGMIPILGPYFVPLPGLLEFKCDGDESGFPDFLEITDFDDGVVSSTKLKVAELERLCPTFGGCLAILAGPAGEEEDSGNELGRLLFENSHRGVMQSS